MKVTAVIKNKDAKGLYRVYIRVNDGNSRKFHPTHIKVLKKDWNGKVKGRDDLNRVIKSRIAAIEAGEHYKDPLFKEYAEKCLLEWANTKRAGTLRQLRSKFDKFPYDIKLSQITPEVLTNYVNYCYQLGNQSNTVWTSLKAIRVLMVKAWKEKLVPDNPFHIFKMPVYRNPPKKFLTKEQVELIDEYSTTNYVMAATWFVIACYTGLRYGDLVKFDKSKIKDGRLIIYTSKTGQVVSIKLNKKLKELFSRVEYKPLPFTNEHYNRILKAVGVETGVGVLTSHQARHTFGALCAANGVSQEVTAKLMGHASIRMTAIYYSLTSDTLDSEVDKIF